MKQNQPPINQARLEAFIASGFALLGWLLRAVLRLGLSGRSAKLKQTLSLAERAVESTLFCKALVLYGPAPRRRPRFTRMKYRRLALFFKGARIRARKAGVLARIFALIDALARPDRAVAYFLKRMRKGLRLTRRIPAPCAADALSCALRSLPALPDTS
ncbi:MAG: hypothetical protein AB7H66_09415 [Hyphomonadaceae bacterium]